MDLGLLKTYLYFFSFLWLFFALAWFFRVSSYRFLYGTMGLIYAVIFFISTCFLRKKSWAWWLAVIFIGFSILISIFDEIGWIDIAYIILAVVLFFNLLKNKNRLLVKVKK